MSHLDSAYTPNGVFPLGNCSLFKHFIDHHVKDLIEIATEKETEEMLARYMDLSILPKEVVPGKGQGRAVQGYETIWEGGNIPPPGKDDWKRRSPVLGPTGGERETKHLLATPSKPATTDTTSTTSSTPPEKPPQTPIQPTTSVASMSSASSASEWEALPSRTPRRNIQQAWTVTPAPVYDLEEVWKKENFSAMASIWKLSQVDQIYLEELRDPIADVHHWKNDPFEVVRSELLRPNSTV